MEYLRAFITGGIICALSQIVIDKTKITPARLLVTYVVLGVLLTAVGLWQPVVDFGGAGATVPLLGFGYVLAKGVQTAILKDGVLGIFTGGLTGAAGGVTAAVVCGMVIAVLFQPKDKS